MKAVARWTRITFYHRVERDFTWCNWCNQDIRMSSKQMLFWPSSNRLSSMTHLANSFINNQLLLLLLLPSSVSLKTLEHLVLINIELHTVFSNAAGQKGEVRNWRCPSRCSTQKKSQWMNETIHHKVWMLMQYVSSNCDLWLASTVN